MILLSTFQFATLRLGRIANAIELCAYAFGGVHQFVCEYDVDVGRRVCWVFLCFLALCASNYGIMRRCKI